MKRKIILGFITVVITTITITLGNAQTESSDLENTFGCPEPAAMICGKIKQSNGTVITIKGKCKC